MFCLTRAWRYEAASAVYHVMARGDGAKSVFEEADGSYFKIVADYIHLHPMRSGWVGRNTGKSLRS